MLVMSFNKSQENIVKLARHLVANKWREYRARTS